MIEEKNKKKEWQNFFYRKSPENFKKMEENKRKNALKFKKNGRRKKN